MSDFDVLYKKICKLERQVALLQNNSAPTVPIYDPANFPQDAVEGQIAIGSDDNLWKYVSGVWSEAGGGGITVEWMQYSFDTGQTIASGSSAQLDWLEQLTFPPLMSGQSPGLMDMTTSGEQEPRLNVPGLYFFDIMVACEGAMTSGKTFEYEFVVANDFGGSPLDHVTYSVGNSYFGTGGIDLNGYGATAKVAAMAVAPSYVTASPTSGHHVIMGVANGDTVSRTFWIHHAQVFRLTPTTTIG